MPTHGATEIGFRRVNYPALYQGDLRLKISEGALLPILTLHVEDYLLGVVPYEMSNSVPLGGAEGPDRGRPHLRPAQA